MTIRSITPPLCTIALTAALGCTAGDEDTGSSGQAGATVPSTWTVADFSQTQAPLQGVSLTLGDQEVLTDADGVAQLSVAVDTEVQVTGKLADYLDSHWFSSTATGGGGAAVLMDIDVDAFLISRQVMAAFAPLVGLDYDEAKGTVIVPVFVYDGDWVAAPGASVELDASADVVLVPDLEDPIGYVAGNTILPDANIAETRVTFLNVPAGTATPTVTPPAGHSCTVFPGVAAQGSVEVVADSVSWLWFLCTPD